jgi:hypothetical protein
MLRLAPLALALALVLEPLFFDPIEDFPHGKGRVEDGLPHRRHALGMQDIRTADLDHVSIGSDRT